MLGQRGQRCAVIHGAAGFSLIDQIATLAVFATISAIAIPQITNSFENPRLGIEVRNVERELQSARLSAVSSNRPIRVRFNCPTVGAYRRVEVIGTVNTPAAADADANAATRCDVATYPYPAADRNPLTRPNNDGPLQRLNTKVAFSQVQVLEFWPNGTVHVSAVTNPWPTIGNTPVTLKLTKDVATQSITVNGLGKIRIE